MDVTFIKRAKSITSFNLTPSDFQSTKYKKEIQHLYQQHMFPSFKPESSLHILNAPEYNKLVSDLKTDNKEQYERLHNLSLKGIGPAEATLFLLTQEGYLGGGSSAGRDLIIGNKAYEIKAVKWKSKATKDAVMDFRLGTNIPGMTQLESDIQEVFFNEGYTDVIGCPEIKGSLFQMLEKEKPDVYYAFEKRYQELAKDYFSSHETVFIQTKADQPDFGEIISIKHVKPEDIKMERYTNKSIKPLVKV